jgi:hypothetical protein
VKLYSIYDQSNIGASLGLSNSNMVVTTTANGLSVNRMVRCLYPASAYFANCEWIVYGTGSITNMAYVGVDDGSGLLTNYVGQGTHGYGFKLSDGKLYNNGAAVATFTACALNDVISMAYNPITLGLSFYQNGNLLGTYTLPSSGPWYPAASIGSTVAGDLSVFFNGGQQAFQYPLGGTFGWWTPVADINPVRVASEDFTALTSDSVPNAVYDGVISTQASSLKLVRMVNPWPWRQNRSSFSGGESYGSITIDDPGVLQADGSYAQAYGNLLTLDVRDSPITISRVTAQDSGGSADSAQAIATGVVDRVDTAGDFGKTIYIKDAMAILDQPVQRSLFLPNVDTSAVGRPLPIVVGCVRTVSGILTKSAVPQVLQFTDAPIAQIGGVRVAGKSYNNPTDWTFSTDQRSLIYGSVTFPNGPQGKATADISTVGGSVASLTDILAVLGTHGGLFYLYSSGTDLTAAFNVGGSPGAGSGGPTWAGSGSDPVNPYPRLEFGPEGDLGSYEYISTVSNVCAAGHTFVAEIYVESSAPIPTNTSAPGYIYAGVIAGAMQSGDAWEYNPHVQNTVTNNALQGVTYLTFTNTYASAKPFVLGYQANNFAGPFGEGLAKIKYVKVYDVGNATSFVNLTGTNLATLLQTLIETEGGLTASQWGIASAQAIDTSTGYTSLGMYVDKPQTIRNACQPALDSHCADFYIDRSGVVQVFRLVDPGTVTSSGTIDESVILGPVNAGTIEQGATLGASQDSMIAVTPDNAPGLTTKMGARRNWSPYTQGDFGSTSLTDAPNSLRYALTSTYQNIAASGVQLSRSYFIAQQQEPIPSLFDLVSEAQTEIDRVCALYQQLRYFYAVPVKADFSDSYDIGQAWQLVYPRYGLSAGKAVLIVGITEDPIKEQLTLICWG